MQSLGVQLRLERERQKLDLSLIAEETRINLSYLQAIEADDLAALPGEFFYRSFVRQYSSYLGLQPTETEKLVQDAAGPSNVDHSNQSAAPSFGGYTTQAEQDRSAKFARESSSHNPLEDAQDDGMSRNWLLFAALLIVACGVYFTWRNFSPAVATLPSLATAQPRQSPTAQVLPAPSSSPAASTALSAEDQPSEAPGNATPATSPAIPPVAAPATAVPIPEPAKPDASQSQSVGSGPVSVTLVAKEMTWIRITADGKKIFGGTIESGQQRIIQGRDVEVIVGNAGTMDVIYLGKPLSYGTRGQVKTLLFSPEGWKFKPKPVSTEPTADPSNAAPPLPGDR